MIYVFAHKYFYIAGKYLLCVNTSISINNKHFNMLLKITCVLIINLLDLCGMWYINRPLVKEVQLRSELRVAR